MFFVLGLLNQSCDELHIVEEKKLDVWLQWLHVLTSGSPAADRQRSGQRGCAWHGSASPERCTPPSQFHGCGPAGSCGASLLAAAEWLLEHRGIRAATHSRHQKLSSLLVLRTAIHRLAAHLCCLHVRRRSSWRVCPTWFPLNLPAGRPPPPSATGDPELRPSWPAYAPVMGTKSLKSNLTDWFSHFDQTQTEK